MNEECNFISMAKKKKLPVYEMVINMNDDTGVSMNALVDAPAVEVDFVVFDKKEPMYFVDDKEWIVTGVAMRADFPIYRNDKNGEYFIKCSKDTIKTAVKKWAKQQRFNEVNKMHNAKDVANGVYLIESIVVDKERGVQAPQAFKDIEDGSWILSYYIESPEIREKISKGEYKGFSVEGLFGFDFMADQPNAHDELVESMDEIISEFLNSFSNQ